MVLVAEDEPTILALTTRMLSAEGYTVLAAPSGAEALSSHDRRSGSTCS